MRLIDADRLLEERKIHPYYHLQNRDVAIPIIDIEHAPTVNQWIPCSERLPETEISVLIWLPSHWNKNGGTIEIGFLDEDNKWNWLAESMSDYYEIVDYVSAWMPLPEPWKGERNEEGNNDIH